MTGVRIATSRLVIRDLPPRAADRVARFHRENWHFHRPWEPHRPQDYFTEQIQRRVLREEARSKTLLHLWLLAWKRPTMPTGAAARRWRSLTIVGSVTLSSIVHGFFRSCYLGYKMDARYTRRGLMKEALVGVIEYAFSTMELHRLEANVMPRNQASRGLLAGLGFREEGTARRYLQIQGQWEDHLHMVMLSEEWRGLKNAAGG